MAVARVKQVVVLIQSYTILERASRVWSQTTLVTTLLSNSRRNQSCFRRGRESLWEARLPCLLQELTKPFRDEVFPGDGMVIGQATWNSASCSVWLKSWTRPPSFNFLAKTKEPQKYGKNNPKINVGTVEPCHGWWACVTAPGVDGEQKRPLHSISCLCICSDYACELEQFPQEAGETRRAWLVEGFLDQSFCSVSLYLFHFNQMFCFCWNWYRHPLKMAPLWMLLIFLPKVILVGYAGKSFCLLAIPPCWKTSCSFLLTQ